MYTCEPRPPPARTACPSAHLKKNLRTIISFQGDWKQLIGNNFPLAHGLTRPCPFAEERKSAGELARAPIHSCFYQLFWLFPIIRRRRRRWRMVAHIARRACQPAGLPRGLHGNHASALPVVHGARARISTRASTPTFRLRRPCTLRRRRRSREPSRGATGSCARSGARTSTRSGRRAPIRACRPNTPRTRIRRTSVRTSSGAPTTTRTRPTFLRFRVDGGKGI